MRSTWGRRGTIMEKFGWTWEYINWGIPFAVIQRIMADLPWFKYNRVDAKGKPKKKPGVKLTSDNVGDIINQFNSLPR